MTVTFGTLERVRVRMSKKVCMSPVTSHNNNCQNVAQTLNLADNRTVELIQMLNVVTLTPV